MSYKIVSFDDIMTELHRVRREMLRQNKLVWKGAIIVDNNSYSALRAGLLGRVTSMEFEFYDKGTIDGLEVYPARSDVALLRVLVEV